MNAWKHAGTAEAEVRLEQQEDQLCIQVQDRGAGFDIAVAADTDAIRTAPQFGLFSIRERMKALGGAFRLESAPAKGTTATLVLPLGPAVVRDEHAVPAHHEEPSRPHPKGSVPDIQDALGRNKRRVGVLLVDDHAMVRQGLRSVLEAMPISRS